MNSQTEENYLKSIYVITVENVSTASTNAIAKSLDTKASSVTDMLKKLGEKDLVNYTKYKGTTLTKKGHKIAANIIRKHRLWEVFLVERLAFGWEEVHEIAEQLEHIKSKELINRIDKLLDFPRFDPHGDPIPDKDGNVMLNKDTVLASELKVGEAGVIVGVNDTSTSFLKYLEGQRLTLGATIKVNTVYEYDNSIAIITNGNQELTISSQVSNNICLKKS